MDLYTLEALSERLGGVPLSTLKHRITQLGIQPTARGSRNKLLFDERAAALIEASDQLLREGKGITSTRRLLGLEAGQEEAEGPEMTALPAPRPLPDRSGSEADPEALDRLSHALEQAMTMLDAKDRQVTQLQEELRRSTEAAATYQQKVFYLQSELQRLQGELKEAYKQAPSKGWKGLFKREV